MAWAGTRGRTGLQQSRATDASIACRVGIYIEIIQIYMKMLNFTPKKRY